VKKRPEIISDPMYRDPARQAELRGEAADASPPAAVLHADYVLAGAIAVEAVATALGGRFPEDHLSQEGIVLAVTALRHLAAETYPDVPWYGVGKASLMQAVDDRFYDSTCAWCGRRDRALGSNFCATCAPVVASRSPDAKLTTEGGGG
jgi:hypothetical protein